MGANVLVANYHAPEETNIDGSIEILRKFGVSNIVLQKDIFNAKLYFELLTLSKFGDLARMTQFKSADEEARTGQLLTYPVLMAHDIVDYDEVLVGEDQEQHIQYGRKLIRKYNKTFNCSYRIPTMNIVVGRIKDLKFPDKKMSKSSPDGCLFLDDKPEDMFLKLKKATATELGLENLSFLYKEFVDDNVPSSNELLKRNLAERIIGICQI